MPRAKAKAKAKAKARAQRAAQVEASNERRDRRVAAVRELNRLAAEVGAKPVNRHRPTVAKVACGSSPTSAQPSNPTGCSHSEAWSSEVLATATVK